MRSVNLALATLIMLACATVSPALANDAEDAPPTSPTWCQKGWTCVPTSWLAERVARVWELRGELEREKAKHKRLGFTLGCGVGVAGVVDKDFNVQIVPAGTCGILYGIRF